MLIHSRSLPLPTRGKTAARGSGTVRVSDLVVSVTAIACNLTRAEKLFSGLNRLAYLSLLILSVGFAIDLIRRSRRITALVHAICCMGIPAVFLVFWLYQSPHWLARIREATTLCVAAQYGAIRDSREIGQLEQAAGWSFLMESNVRNAYGKYLNRWRDSYQTGTQGYSPIHTLESMEEFLKTHALFRDTANQNSKFTAFHQSEFTNAKAIKDLDRQVTTACRKSDWSTVDSALRNLDELEGKLRVDSPLRKVCDKLRNQYEFIVRVAGLKK